MYIDVYTHIESHEIVDQQLVSRGLGTPCQELLFLLQPLEPFTCEHLLPVQKKKVSDIVHLRLKVTLNEMNPPPLMDIIKSQCTGTWAIQTHCMLNLEQVQIIKNITIKLLFSIYIY